MISSTSSGEERERVLKMALMETLQKQKAGEKEVVRLNLKLQVGVTARGGVSPVCETPGMLCVLRALPRGFSWHKPRLAAVR